MPDGLLKVLLFFNQSSTGRAVRELMVVVVLQGNLDPALNRHASLPSAQLAALCEVAASCLEPQPTDRSAPAHESCPTSHADQTKLHQKFCLSGTSALLQTRIKMESRSVSAIAISFINSA